MDESRITKLVLTIEQVHLHKYICHCPVSPGLKTQSSQNVRSAGFWVWFCWGEKTWCPWQWRVHLLKMWVPTTSTALSEDFFCLGLLTSDISLDWYCTSAIGRRGWRSRSGSCCRSWRSCRGTNASGSSWFGWACQRSGWAFTTGNHGNSFNICWHTVCVHDQVVTFGVCVCV